MANKQYPDVAAARHMRDARLAGDTHSLEVPAADRAPTTAVPASKPQDSRYRRQKFVAIAVITLIAVSVPALAALLFLFG